MRIARLLVESAQIVTQPSGGLEAVGDQQASEARLRRVWILLGVFWRPGGSRHIASAWSSSKPEPAAAT